MHEKRLKKLKETKEENKMLKDKRGITLIALVVTIVVLLILAGVSISLILDNNGIIQRSKDARKQYGEAQANEQADLESISSWIEDQVNGNTENPKPIKVKEGEKATSNGTINGEEGDSNNPTIPEGYTPINTDTSNWGDGSSAPTQNDVNHGLVIRDDSNNEWVWIPVTDVTVMCDTANTTEYTLYGTEGKTAVTTKLYSRTITIGKGDSTKTMTRIAPGTGDDFREPDLVICNRDYYDAEQIHYQEILGFENKEEMAKTFVVDYGEMIESIKKYGGFYIGRYELSEEGVQKDKSPLYESWYYMYDVCRDDKLKASNKVKTQMIWGCQWDVTMNWLISSGAKTSDEVNNDSSSWGNYKDTSVKADDGTKEIKESGTTLLLNTGVTTFTMANNIYDLAGNCGEWTQEGYGFEFRAIRSGSSASSSEMGQLTHSATGSRPTLIIK